MQNDSAASLSVSDGFNRLSFEKKLRKSYMELYIDEGLFSILDGTPIEPSGMDNSDNIYELPFDENGVVNFSILIHDINVGLDVNRKIEDSYASWNRCEMNSPHICASYIRRDCLLKTGDGVSFGFNNVIQDDLVAASPTDAYSNGCNGFITIASEKYCSPEKQIMSTGLIDDNKYNEIDIRRFIENDGKVETRQPDYIIIFKSDGNISRMDRAQKVSEDFERHTGRKLPILVIDKDKCRETEMLQIAKMQLEYENNPTEKLVHKTNDKKQILMKESNFNLIEDSIEAYKISLMQIQLEKNPSNNELREKIENLKQSYIKKLIEEKRIATGIKIETNRDFETEEQIVEWSEEELDTDNTNDFLDDDLENWDRSDSWDEEINDSEIIESFNQLINKKHSILKEFAERGKTAQISETFLTDEKAKQIARSEGVPFKKEFGQEDFTGLENIPEINKEVKSFD